MDEAIARYPREQKRSASLPLLHLWQEHFGFINDDAVTWIAAKLGLQPINILELVTFLSDVAREKRRQNTHPRLSHAQLRNGWELPVDGQFLRCYRHPTQKPRRTDRVEARTEITASNSSNVWPVAAPRRSA